MKYSDVIFLFKCIKLNPIKLPTLKALESEISTRLLLLLT